MRIMEVITENMVEDTTRLLEDSNVKTNVWYSCVTGMSSMVKFSASRCFLKTFFRMAAQNSSLNSQMTLLS